MNATHIHLLVNHLAIVGTILGGFVLLYGLLVKSTHTQISAYGLFVISSLGAVITYLTGEPAEESVEHLAGVSENIIEQHEDFSVFALISLIALGIASIFALYSNAKKLHWANSIAKTTFVLCIISFALIARTGYLGGMIRHSEINSKATSQEPKIVNEVEDDD